MSAFDYSEDPNAVRFRAARERLGWSPVEAAERLGVMPPEIWHIEMDDDELLIYTPAAIRGFCEGLGIHPRELFGIEINSEPLTACELVKAIEDHLQSTGVSQDDFENAVGWFLSRALANPELLNTEYCVEAVQDICGGAGLDWQRYFL